MPSRILKALLLDSIENLLKFVGNRGGLQLDTTNPCFVKNAAELNFLELAKERATFIVRL